MPALRIDRDGIDPVREESFRLLDEIDPCGFILFGGRAHDVARLTAELNARAGRPLLFGADLERGAGQQFEGLTRIPTPMAIAACPEARSLACLAGKLTAVEARSIGVNLLFAPVCDVNTEPKNPIMNVRSFSGDSRTVGELAKQWIHGAQAAGAIACAKHFPGHGNTTKDSHLELPEGPRDEAEFRSVHLQPFRDAIAAGVGSLMVAHMTVPAIDDSGLPATLSRRVVTDLLRGELGFDGLVITDALVMKGIHTDEIEAAVLAAYAGCDILLYPDSPRAVLQRLRESERDPVASMNRVERLLAHPLAAKIARSCLTLLDGRPVAPECFLVIHDDDRLDPAPFREAARAAGWRELARDESPRDPSRCVTAVFAMPGAWRGRSGPSEENRMKIPAGSGVISFGDPYFLAQVTDASFRIAAYDDHPLTQRAAVAALQGGHGFAGRVPF